MSVLARPGVLASLLAASALVLHPSTFSPRWMPGRFAVLAALLALAALGLLARLSARMRSAAAWLSAAGAAVLLAALGVDGLRGHHGTLAILSGEARPHFDEAGPDGRTLGLRPLGFVVGAERILDSGVVFLRLPGGGPPVELTPERSVSFGGLRFARPRAVATGGASRLRVAASDGVRTVTADVAPGAPGRALDLTIALEEYFPDFALDDKQRPYSRSSEARNPAALLAVEKGGQTHRAFVLKAMPGVHRVEPLGFTFSLLEVAPERRAEIAVHREPAALVVLLGAVLLAVGVALSWPSLPALPAAAVGGDPDAPVLPGGALALLLAAVDRGSVLAWSFDLAVDGGRVPLAGVGVLLGAALILALGGTLLLAAARLAGEGAGSRPLARGALWLAVLLAGAALALALARMAALPAGPATALPLAGVGFAAAVLAGALVASRTPSLTFVSRAAPLVLPLGVVAAIGLAVVAGVAGVWRDGTYATPAAAASAAAALLGLGALEPTGAPGLRRFAFLLALLALAIV